MDGITFKEDNIKERTLGDGMESSLIEICSNYNPNILKSLQPVIPTSPIIILKPKYVPKERKQQKLLFQKQKEPKFVPYEPYKAAVQPIIPQKKLLPQKKEVNLSKPSKNNVDIQNLVTQMTEMRINELNKATAEAIRNDDVLIPKKKWEEEKTKLETDIKNLRESNAHLANQLKFQAQVNSELKTLLVAAVGEDLESRVQHLTEDKLQLARALLNSANHLTSHQEQTEWLSGQCEVWRSKFLASSLMVEELARWKSALSTRIADLQDCLKCLLEERNKVYDNSVNAFYSLHSIQDCHKDSDIKMPSLKSKDIVELSHVNMLASRNIKDRLNVQKDMTELSELLLKLPQYTVAESGAIQLLKNPVSLSTKPDAICAALMGAAMSVHGGQMYLQHPTLHASCCSHCMGEVQNI